MILFNEDILYLVCRFSLVKDIISLLLLNKFIYENNKKILNTSWYKEKQVRSYFSLDMIKFLGGIDNLVKIPFYYNDHLEVLTNYKKCPTIFLGTNNKISYLVIKIKKDKNIITTILFRSLIKTTNNWFIKNLDKFCRGYKSLNNPYVNSFGSFNPLYFNNTILRYNLQTILNKETLNLKKKNKLLLKYYDKYNLKTKIETVLI